MYAGRYNNGRLRGGKRLSGGGKDVARFDAYYGPIVVFAALFIDIPIRNV
jgi:hypothetical protein